MEKNTLSPKIYLRNFRFKELIAIAVLVALALTTLGCDSKTRSDQYEGLDRHDLNVVKALGLGPNAVLWDLDGRLCSIVILYSDRTKIDLSGCAGLVFVDLCSSYSATSLDITGCTSLISLGVSDNSELTTIKGATTCTKLNEVDIQNCPKLSQLEFRANDTYDYYEVPGLFGPLHSEHSPHFTIKNCSSLSRIDFTGSDRLCELRISNMPRLSSVAGLVNCKKLKVLRISDAAVTELDVTGCAGLRDCQLENLPELSSLKGYGPNIERQFISLSGCGLSTLDCHGVVGRFEIGVDTNVNEIYIPEEVGIDSSICICEIDSARERWSSIDKNWKIVDRNNNDYPYDSSPAMFSSLPYSFSSFYSVTIRFSDPHSRASAYLSSIYTNNDSAWSQAPPIRVTSYSRDQFSNEPSVLSTVTIKTGAP